MALTAEDTLSSHDEMAENARAASDLLKALSNETRLMILCMLAEEEKSVSDLEELLDMRQPTVSQQLARLRADRLVTTRRDGKMIYYGLASNEARAVIKVLYDIYCAPE
ncbi:MAG: metalloregulator ArsR/SmtB family transcription factor [Hyphomicrobiales bacterium]